MEYALKFCSSKIVYNDNAIIPVDSLFGQPLYVMLEPRWTGHVKGLLSLLNDFFVIKVNCSIFDLGDQMTRKLGLFGWRNKKDFVFGISFRDQNVL